jgi:beta-glucanase (GH16 family)
MIVPGRVPQWSPGVLATRFADGGIDTPSGRRRNDDQQIYLDPGFDQTVPFSLGNGRRELWITAQKVPPQAATFGRFIVSGMINSVPSFSQQFGFFELRCAMPIQQGMLPAFWLLADPSSVPTSLTLWPPEVDVFEHINDSAGINSGEIWGVKRDAAGNRVGTLGWKQTTKLSALLGRPFNASEIHSYGVLWSQTGSKAGPLNLFRWYVDDIQIAERTEPLGRFPWPMAMLVTLAVGSHWPGSPDPAWQTSVMRLDSLKAWELKV